MARHRMGIAAVPARLACIFCEGKLRAETCADDGSFLIKCNGCCKEMIDCDCLLPSHQN
jgi:hypothetical protein